jgi:hypothetical protein
MSAGELTGDIDEIVQAVLEEGGCPLACSEVARRVAARMGRDSSRTRNWITGYLQTILPVFESVGISVQFGSAEGRPDALTLRVPQGHLRLEEVRDWWEKSAPYGAALLLHRLYGACALKPPFPSIEQVARTVGVEPERLADAVRIAVFLPPRWLLELGISWRATQLLTHEDLVEVSGSGEEVKRVEALVGRLGQAAERRGTAA